MKRNEQRLTRGQKEAMKKLQSKPGRLHLSAEDCAHLGTHPDLSAADRNDFINLAIKKGW